MGIEALFASIRDECQGNEWSQAVELARNAEFLIEKISENEITLRMAQKGRLVSPKITFWPLDTDWTTDVEDPELNNIYGAAAIIAYKHGRVVGSSNTSDEDKNTPSAAPVTSRVASVSTILRYNLVSTPQGLKLDRYIQKGDDVIQLNGKLTLYISGVREGRIDGYSIAATKIDFAIDDVISSLNGKPLCLPYSSHIINFLSEIEALYFNDMYDNERKITASTTPYTLKVILSETREGFRLSIKEPTFDRLSRLVIVDDILYHSPDAAFTTEEKQMFSDEGWYFSKKRSEVLAAQVIPKLKSCFDVEGPLDKLPAVVECAPQIVLHIDHLTKGPETYRSRFQILPQILYGHPPIAQLNEDLECFSEGAVPRRRKDIEDRLLQHLTQSLGLNLNTASVLIQKDLAALLSKIVELPSGTVRVDGQYSSKIILDHNLTPQINVTDDDFSVTCVLDQKELQIPLGDMLERYNSGHKMVELPDGGYARLPLQWLQRYADRLNHLLALKSKHGKLPSFARYQLSLLASENSDRLPTLLDNLRRVLEQDAKPPEATLPSDLRANLRTYQQEGIAWLQFMKANGIGALLADDMGLGKTLQAICTLHGRCLIIAPTSVIHTWKEQIQQFRPGITIHLYHGTNRSWPETFTAQAGEQSSEKTNVESSAEVLITSYNLVRIENEKFTMLKWDSAILDEAQNIKNPLSQISNAVYAIEANSKLALSGTPIENSLRDIASIFRFLNPGLIPQQQLLDLRKLTSASSSTATRITNLCRPFVLRRKKYKVASELPPKTEQLMSVDLSDEERELYNTILAATRKDISRLLEQKQTFHILEILLRLRQACTHPKLIEGSGVKTSSKTKALMENLDSVIKEGHKAIIFSQWTKLLDIISHDLNKRSYKHVRIDGSTRNRQSIILEFQQPRTENKIILMSLKAGGVGINLTAADYVYFLDPWWNPAIEDQAADRAHRIGQARPVFVYRLIARDTIEERVIGLQNAKRAIADSLWDETEASATMNMDDIKYLLGDL